MENVLPVSSDSYSVLDIRSLTESVFVLRLPRGDFKFIAGQHISLSLHNDFQSREYSVYSGENSDYLEVLVKEIEGGYFSPKLRSLKNGDIVEIQGPFGRFGIDEDKMKTHQHIFIASGTGIAPFHSMVQSYPDLDYRLILGVRYGYEAYEREVYDESRFVLCTTGDDSGDYHGRLTGYLKETNFEPNSSFYLCGNSDMIFDAMDILKSKGVNRNDLNVEVYF